MTAEHVATATQLTKELVADMRAELMQWMKVCAPDLAAQTLTTADAVERVCFSVIEEAVEHVQIRFATTLATFGVSA